MGKSNRGGEVAYAACGECKKALQQDGTKRCSCTSDERMTCWKATFSLMDDSGQLTAKCFEEIADLIPFHSEDHEDADPGTYLNSMAKVDALMESIAAVPFTVLLSFEDSEYSERIEAQIRRITPTTAECTLANNYSDARQTDFHVPRVRCGMLRSELALAVGSLVRRPCRRSARSSKSWTSRKDLSEKTRIHLQFAALGRCRARFTSQVTQSSIN